MLTKAGYTVKSDLHSLNDLQAWFRQLCRRNQSQWTAIEGQVYRLNLALAEGFTNAVRHAHAGLPADTRIEVKVALGPAHVEIQIWDAGHPFDPNSIEEPQPGTLRKGGYGWFLLRRLVDRVSYDRQGNRNCLRMQKSWT
ncbi:ATP-binding protein [filamentous cyanobacterium LEGE 11480]|uniref:ATP-binding protein n=1 Tax=Romeriopsis navalis LEGE 11480 TaxID=2777977 RepID=A0A928VVH2_9CYAN|nr:ATP-binding protein [Romeriopsis navalis]MBE9032969.1 ATP-binding protein [Romeriopsis navalis LEGE 11480]